jgi:RHS repeat-associated protein
MVCVPIFSPFGEAVISIATVENPFRFPGQYYDGETGLHYNYHRYYNPPIGRYITPDPIGLEGGINLFAYAGNNPIRVIDPLGLLTCFFYIRPGSIVCHNKAGDFFWATAASGLDTNEQKCQNNTDCIPLKDKGPLPVGSYEIKPLGYDPKYPSYLPLKPSSWNKMGDRTGFFIHKWGTSKGCIMLHTSDFNTISNWATQDNGGTLYVNE